MVLFCWVSTQYLRHTSVVEHSEGGTFFYGSHDTPSEGG